MRSPCGRVAGGGTVTPKAGATTPPEKAALLNPRFAVIGDPSGDWAPLLQTIGD